MFPRAQKRFARENGYAIIENGPAIRFRGRQSRFTMGDHDNLVVVTGMISREVTPNYDENNIEKASGLSLAHSFPHLRTYFLQTPATTFDQLSRYLASARELNGVFDAGLDLIEARNTPK